MGLRQGIATQERVGGKTALPLCEKLFLMP